MPEARHSQRSRARTAPYGVLVPRFKIETKESGAPEEIRTPDPQIRSLGSKIDSAQLLSKPGLKRPLADQCVSIRVANQECQRSCDHDAPAEEDWVRVRSATSAGHECQRHPKRPAHPSNRLIAQLNTSWRVVDDPLQWVLQRRAGNPRAKNSGWANRSFCTTRDGLLRCAREYCGETDPAAFAALSALPEHHTGHQAGNSAQTNVRAAERND